MNEEQQELLFDLLTKKAVYGLDEAEQRELDQVDPGTADWEFESIEITAAAIAMVGVSTDERLPSHLSSTIITDADRFVGATDAKAETPWPPATIRTHENKEISAERPAMPWFGWLGWAAAAACVVLALALWFTRPRPTDYASVKSPVEVPQALTPAEMRAEMMRSTAGMVKANWAPGNVKDMKQIAGDVVWSDEKQAGYMRLKGLPVNDATKETYQLWIFDKTQDKATPIDGGTFDVSSDGEVVIPINAKLKAKGPEMFAITVEKPGGVVVSKREKLAAIAKVESQAS